MAVNVTSNALLTVETSRVTYNMERAFNANPDGLECTVISLLLFVIIYDDMHFARFV